MNGILKVTPEKLMSAAGELEGSGSSMKNCTDEMISLVNEISAEVWSGDAAVAYKTKFSELQGDMDRIFRMVTEHARDLNEMANNYNLAETENQELAGALNTQVIV